MNDAAPDMPGPAMEILLHTGVPGLDDVLGGGLTANRLYLLEGAPGTGKTTIALQFLQDGAARGEAVLYITLSETLEELQGVARSHGWDLRGVQVREMLPAESALAPDEQSTMFHPSELELGETTLKILADVERIKPTRVVFDSLSELRLLAGNSLRYRRQILALKQFFAGRQCTVLLLDDMTTIEHNLQVQSIAHLGAHHGLIGGAMQSPVDASYLADTVVLLRYFELDGDVKQAISVVKKRGSAHERTIRSLTMRAEGIHIGEPLRNYRGILTGVPVPTGVNGTAP
jgi:KaiC/GvpD/RAD55 family RecA-like ATPase